MRLVYADVLIKQCKPRGIADEVWKESNEYKQIINAPTIDAVEVVRCKDCKYGEYRKGFDDYECHASGCGLVYDAEFYCADGLRREDGE